MSPSPPAREAPRIQSLDGLRAFSIVLVIFGHARATFGFPKWPWLDGYPTLKRVVDLLSPLDVAHFGVRVFFVISGFLITSLLMGELKKTGGVSLGAFYIKRAFRIFPPYYFYLLVIMALAWLGFAKLPWKDGLLAFTYTINYSPERVWYVGHAWSLSIEEQFYLIWPAVFRATGTRRGPVIALAVIAASPLIRVAWALIFTSKLGRSMVSEVFLTVADSIATGCVLALYRPRLHADDRYLRVLRSPVTPALALSVAGAALWLEVHHTWVMWAVGETAMNLAVALIVDRYVHYPEGPAGRVLNWRPVSYIGMVSYSLYLWQQPFLQAAPAGGAVPPVWMRFPYNLGFMWVAALLSYYLIEKPSLKLRARVMGEGKAPAPAPAPREPA